MGEPKLYERYHRHEAIALFGPEGEAQVLCDGQWVIFPDVVLCFAEVGDPPRMSHFSNGGEFCCVADRPYRVSDEKHVKFVPREVVARHARGRTIHLFVRSRGSDHYLYIGKLGPSYVQIHGVGTPDGAARFRLSPALPSEVWIGLGGLQPGELDHAAIDAALDRLRDPVNVEERLWVLRQLVDYWHGPIRKQDGLTEAELAGCRLPAALRWWYRWAGRRSDIMSGQNFLLAPRGEHAQPFMVDDRLFFYAENQGVYQWSTLPDGDDPPVFGRYNDGEPWEQERVRVSEHLILACLFEALMCHGRFGASAAWLDEDKLAALVEHIPPIAIPPWRWLGLRFFVARDAFMCAGLNGSDKGKQYYSVRIGAKKPLRFLRPLLDDRWDCAVIDWRGFLARYLRNRMLRLRA